MLYKTKKIWLNGKKTRYCWVRLYADKLEMQKAYHRYRPDDNDYDKIGGAHCAHVLLTISESGEEKISDETGRVYLCFDYCGASIIAHELGHAVLYANRENMIDEQHPIVIRDMEEEEEILYNLTYAIRQFYDWYWKIEKHFKPVI